MQKIDKRRTYYIGLDTETCYCQTKDGKVNTIYDFGWVITDKHGNIYKTRSYIVKEVFFDRKKDMQSAYYAKKIPQYLEGIKQNSPRVLKFQTIISRLIEDATQYNIKAIFAHNASFDVNAIKNTFTVLSENLDLSVLRSEYLNIYSKYNIQWWDTLKMSKQTIGTLKKYQKFCIENSYITKSGNCRFTAEILYRYLIQDVNFEEAHTGLADVLIETTIFTHCFRMHKSMKPQLNSYCV